MRFHWSDFTGRLMALILAGVALSGAQESPFAGKTVVDPPPEGFQFPLEFTGFQLLRDGEKAGTVMLQVRGRMLPAEFTVKQMVCSGLQINGQPATTAPYSREFSTEKPADLPAMEIQRAPQEMPAPVGMEIHLTGECHVLAGLGFVDTVRFAAREIALRFPLDVRIPAVAGEEAVQAREIARHYAPVIYQQTNDPRRDFITRFDFDGNWRGDDNADHVNTHPLPAYVYYSFVRTTSHFFVGYYLYHPVDYVKASGPSCGFFNHIGSHENDLEGMQLVIENDGSRHGNLLLMETLAHNVFYQLENSDRIKDRREVPSVLEDVDGHIEFEAVGEGRHPKLYAECLGHGVWGYGHNGKSVKPSDAHVVYRPGAKAREPSGPDDRDVPYELIDINDPAHGLWTRRKEIAESAGGSIFAKPALFWDGFGYVEQLGSAFLGRGGNQARPPWGWKAKGSRRGDWFLAPAHAFGKHLLIPGLEAESGGYAYNPFLKQQGGNPGAQFAQADDDLDDSSPLTEPESGAVPEKSGEQAKTGLAGVAQIVFEKTKDVEKIESASDLVKIVGDLAMPVATAYLNVSAEEASRISFRYKSILGVKRVRVFWITDQMTDFDEEHSVQLELSAQPGWHWQTVELLEVPSYDRLATIRQFKLQLEFEKESFDWSASPAQILELLRDLPSALKFFTERSGYLNRGDARPAPAAERNPR